MSNDKLAHSTETILECFSDIDAGKVHHWTFSHANVVMVSKEHYAALQDAAHEAEKQAGPVAGLIGKMTAQRAKFFLMRFRQKEAMLGPNEQAALAYAVSALEREQYAAPPSESDKEDAELTNAEIDAMVAGHFRGKRHPDSYTALRSTIRDAIRAARAKKEQP